MRLSVRGHVARVLNMGAFTELYITRGSAIFPMRVNG